MNPYLPLHVAVASLFWTKLMDLLASAGLGRTYQWVGQFYLHRLKRIEATYCGAGHVWLKSGWGDGCARCGKTMKVYTSTATGTVNTRVRFP